jgi:hypothetical protein
MMTIPITVEPTTSGECRCGLAGCTLPPWAFADNVEPEPVWGRLPPRHDRRSGGVSSIYTTA